MVRALHAPRFGLSILREQRGLCGHPHPGAGNWAICIWHIGGITGAVGLDQRGDLFTERNAVLLRRPVLNPTQGLGIGFIDLGFLRRHELDQDFSRCGHGGSVGGSVGRGGSGRHIARVPCLDGVDRVGHRDVHHRHGSRPWIADHICGLQHLEGDLIPVGHRISVCGCRAESHEDGDHCDGQALHDCSPSARGHVAIGIDGSILIE